jgi:hypothetical protein
MADNTVYNEKMGYMMNTKVNEKVDDKVKSILGNKGMGAEMKKEDEENIRYSVWDSSVFDLVTAAQDLYCSGEKDLNETLSMLITSFNKLKGKEDELKKCACKAYEDEE